MGEFSGTVNIQKDGTNEVTIALDGNTGDITAGGNGTDGDLLLKNVAGNWTIRLDGEEGDIIVRREINGVQREVMKFDASSAALYIGSQDNEGDLIVRNGSGKVVFSFDSASANLYIGPWPYVAATPPGPGLTVRDNAQRTTLRFDGNSADLYIGATNNEGDIFVRDNAGRDAFHLDGRYAALYIGATDNEGDIRVRDNSGKDVFHLDGSSADLYIGATDNEGDIFVRDNSGKDVFHFNGQHANLYIGATDNEGDIFVRDNSGNPSIHLDGGARDIKLQGADCAEEFDVTESEEIDPGTVLVIDDESKLRPCRGSYDRKVAGVVSGAYGTGPGIILGKNSTQSRRLPIALNGKVYCKVDAQYSPIEVGDLLTTSDTPGHAMKVADPAKAFGTVVGKALHPLREGSGMIPILVALQ